ncbi:ribonuclease E/G [Lagierella sp. ICN-221743]
MIKQFVEKKKDELIVGSIKDNKLQNIIKIANSEAVFIARIERKMPNYSGYIISLDNKEKGLLDENKTNGQVKPGDTVLVGLYKKTTEDKLDKYTMNYSIPGRYIVYYPNSNKVNVSKKVPEDKREILLQKAKENKIQGVDLRTNSYKVNFSKIITEYERLKKVNEKILQESKFLPVPRKLFTSYKNLFSILEDKENIIVNDGETYKFLEKYLDGKKIFLDENYSYEFDGDIEDDLVNLKRGFLPLPSGGNIIIENTKAMTVVDVNGLGDKNFLETNREAVRETLRAIDVLNLNGIVVVDAITMNKKDEKLLAEFVEDELKSHSKIKFHGITKLGLLEFTKSAITVDISR